MAKISVIMPAYNRASFIGETIESILGQTYQDWELIIVDDGSTDNTQEVVSRYPDPRIRCVRQANAGETAARNAGLSLAKGEYIACIDSDDLMLPHNLEVLLKTLEADPEAGCAYGWFYFMDASGQPLPYQHGQISGVVPQQIDQPWPGKMPPLSGISDEGQILPQLLSGPEGTLAIGSFLSRRKWVDAIQGFNPARKHQGHWDFFVRLARAGCAYACCRQAVMLFREHGSGAHRNYEKMVAARLDVLNTIYKDSEADPQLRVMIAPVRQQAYRTTYITGAENAYAGGDMSAGAKFFNKAIEYGPLKESETTRIVSSFVKWVVEQPGIMIDAAIHEAFDAITPPLIARHASQHAKSITEFTLAFRAYKAGERRLVILHSAKAVACDLHHLRNKGLAKITLNSLLPH
jgi:GT2 family glycosyltransferase